MFDLPSFKRVIIRAINSLFPKNKKKVMFASFPNFGDNSRALYEFMMRQESFKDWSFVWEVSQDYKAPQRDRTLFIKTPKKIGSKEYYRYLFHVFTSKYLFCTHSSFVAANPAKQVSVCLWHGTMLKRICAMNEREKDNKIKDQYRYFVSPSKFYEDIFCQSFRCKPKNIITCGYPRNDFLFEESMIFEKLGIVRERFDKIVVYMPTFRIPKGSGYSDSDSNNSFCIDLSDRQSVLSLSEFLKRKKILMIIKWHPADSRQTIIKDLSNVYSINNYFFAENDLQTYHLLHYADALITDYSSVFCDYLLLNRPIAFDISDIDSYANKRGFVFDQPLEYMPGYKIKSKQDLELFIDDVANNIDRFSNLRMELYQIYNDFCDGNSSERIVNMLQM